jgi:hypothetical protein
MRGRVFVAIAAVAGAACTWLACSDDVRSHVYSGREYDSTRHCLLDLQSIDVVAGPEDDKPCAPVCVTSLADDAGSSLIYVSTQCPPYPLYPYDSDAGGDPRCAAALLANEYDTSCEDDGAIVNWPPEAGGDAGVDGDASDVSDAAPDVTDAAPDMTD